MFRSTCARLLLILLVVAAVATPAAWGSPRHLAGEIAPPDIFARFWNALTAIWGEAGCGLDPHGGCATAASETPAPPTADAGCMIDPHGGCATAGTVALAPTADAGCTADPHGGCTTGN